MLFLTLVYKQYIKFHKIHNHLILERNQEEYVIFKKLTEMQNAVDVISTLVSRGYITGEALIEEMKRKAKELDESMTISQRIELASKYTNEKISELDRNLGISSTLSSFTQKGKIISLILIVVAVKVSADTYKNLDETLGINKALNEAKLGAVALGSSVKTGATELSKTVCTFLKNGLTISGYGI